MNLEALQSLKLSMDTGDMSFFHGDASEAFKEIVDDLIQAMTARVDSDLNDGVREFISESVLRESLLENRINDLRDFELRMKSLWSYIVPNSDTNPLYATEGELIAEYDTSVKGRK